MNDCKGRCAEPGCPRPWEIRVAWALRGLIAVTATVHLVQGRYLYAALCAAVIAVLVAPPLLARTSLGNLPVELELAALWGAVGDMTLGSAPSSLQPANVSAGRAASLVAQI